MNSLTSATTQPSLTDHRSETDLKSKLNAQEKSRQEKVTAVFKKKQESRSDDPADDRGREKIRHVEMQNQQERLDQKRDRSLDRRGGDLKDVSPDGKLNAQEKSRQEKLGDVFKKKQESRGDDRVDDRGREKIRHVETSNQHERTHQKRDRSSDIRDGDLKDSSTRKTQKVETRFDQKKETKTHHLPMKGTIYLDNIKSGLKTHEGRVYRGTCASMRVGDKLILRDNRANRGIECEIISCKRYASFKEMLLDNGVLNMLPQLTDYAKKVTPQALVEEGVNVYNSFPGSDGVARFGCVAIGVRFIKDC